MESTAGIADGDGRGEEGSGKECLCLDFGYPSSHLHYQPPKLIRTDTFPFRMVTPRSPTTVAAASSGSRAESPPSRHPFASPSNSGIVSSGGRTTVFCYNSAMSDSYGTPRTMSDSYGTPRTLQPFAVPFKSSGIAGDATLQLCSPFTAAQWQELHRQALIFKYIMASNPVPPELLFCSGTLPDTHPLFSNLGLGGDYLNLRFTGNNGDLEPGRCRRTDGKKWRCSKDVAPGQKYCERHMHRARPRSRKPVEHDKRAGLAAADGPAASSSISASMDRATQASTSEPSSLAARPHREYSSPELLPSVDMKLPFQFMVPQDKKLSDFGSWRGDDAEAQAETQHGQLLSSKTGLRRDTSLLLQQQYEDQTNLHCTSLDDQRGYRFGTIIPSSEDVSAHQFHRGTPTRFIDAWSRGNLFGATISEKEHQKTSSGGSSPVPSSIGNLSPSNLTLAMAGSSYGGGEVQDHTQMRLGISDSVKTHAPSWMNPVSPVGGPLAEVLQSRNVSVFIQNDCGAGKDLVPRVYAGATDRMSKSSCGGEGASASPRGSATTRFSSPTAVLQKSLVSVSDSSGNSSPTTFGPGPRPELPL